MIGDLAILSGVLDSSGAPKIKLVSAMEIDTSQISYEITDLQTFKHLLKIFDEVFDEPGTYQDELPSDHYLGSLLSDPNFIAVAAVTDGKVVGGLAAYVLKKYEQERSEIYIYDLAVKQQYWRQGIATGLINKLREIALEMGVWVIFVQADAGDEPAIKLYESLGTREDVHHFDIKP